MVLAASFLILEVLMIVLDPYVFKGRFQYDPEMGFRVRAYYPNGLGLYGNGDDGTLTNRFGFNAPDLPLKKPAGSFRILFVGDSFGWAGGLKGNYTALLQQMFDARSGLRRVEIVNTGYPATHTGEQLMMLRRYGLQYDPDLVVLGFFAGNDFFEADPNRKRIIVDDCYVDIDQRYEHTLWGYPIVAQSHLWLFARQKYQIYSQTKRAKQEAADWGGAKGLPGPQMNLPENTFYEIQKAKLEFLNQRTSATQFGPNIDFIYRSITEMRKLLQSRNIKFMVAIYPDEMQVSKTQFTELVRRFGLHSDDYDLDLAQTRLKGFLDSQAIPYLDLLDRFRSEEQKQDLYLFRNTHWNAAGNALAAELLFQYLINQPYEFNSR